jgi:imidazole glycerol-phosphate synthase subunit HisH
MIAIIDYGVGNLFSVEKALLQLGAQVEVTNDESVIRQAQKIVLPGVGAFGDCMENLRASGLIPAIMDMVQQGYPLLGICVGLQILFEGSEESPGVSGLGVFSGTVRKIKAPGLKIPHMGWNSLDVAEPHQPIDLFAGLASIPYVYFVHSYHAVPADKDIITATAEYGETLTAAVARGNVQATQFHPEKSGDVGLDILKNFIQG